MGANVLGLFLPLRSPEIFLNNEFVADRDPELWSEKQALALLARKPGQTDEEYAGAATRAVHKGMAYTWPESLARKYRMRVPAWENYFLFALSLFSEKYFYYEFYDHRKALARGVGLCGHHSTCLVGFLREAGLDARIISMKGHVVATVEVAPGVWHLLDPSFGFTIPESIERATRDRAALAAIYGRHRPFRPEDRQGPLLPASPDHIVDPYFRGRPVVDPYGMKWYFFGGTWYPGTETAAYGLKWPLPILLLLGSALVLGLRARNGRQGIHPE